MFDLAKTLYHMLLFAIGLWGAIKIADRDNHKNYFSFALVIGLVFAAVANFGYLFVALPTIALVVLLLRYYHLTVMQTMIVLLFIIIIMAISDLTFKFIKPVFT